MLHVGVVVLGMYFSLTSLLCLTQTAARYYLARQRHVDFRSRLTFPCCSSSQPVAGLVKMAVAAVLAFAEFSLDRGYQGERAFLSRLELGTVFIFLLFSGVMDVLACWGSKSFYQYVDYAGLVLFFLALVAILESRAYLSEQPVSSLLSLAAYPAAFSALVTVVEGVWSQQVLPPVARSYLFLLQGTWWLHVAVMMSSPVTDTTDTRDSTTQALAFFSVLFCGHAALTFLVVVSLWLLLARMVDRGQCTCLGGEGASHSEDVFLENRVHFNYHVLSRLDVESESD